MRFSRENVGKVRMYGLTVRHIRLFYIEINTCSPEIAVSAVCRGIANPATKEMSSLSVEPAAESADLVVSLFEIEKTPEAVAAWIEREHEFRFIAVQPYALDGTPEAQLAVRLFFPFSLKSPLLNPHK